MSELYEEKYLVRNIERQETELKDCETWDNEPIFKSGTNNVKMPLEEDKNINNLIEKVKRDNARLEKLILQNKRLYQPSRTEATTETLQDDNFDIINSLYNTPIKNKETAPNYFYQDKKSTHKRQYSVHQSYFSKS